MSSRKIAQIGNPVLKRNNKSIRGLKTDSTKKLIKALQDTLRKNDLAGISGPQISKNYKIFLTEIRESNAQSNQKDPLRVFINPVITYYSKTQNIIYEGCRSVVNGQLFGPVRRSNIITVEAYDENGQKYEFKCDGILARTIQHEYDHLNGVLFIELVEDYSKLISEDLYKKKVKNSKKQLEAARITQKSYKLLI
ncbi:peptide deformylase [Candidatus Woesebacteria bacterium]|nr:peptide deformylase [Candidatus Woesebacteria bacterium]